MNLVTGATGFVGAHVVRALLERDQPVRCLARASSPRTNLDGLSVEVVTGDLTELSTLRPAMQGVNRVFHCAADYRLYAPDPAELYAANVEGTRNVLRAASEAEVAKFVYTSSVGTLATSREATSANEDTPVTIEKMVGHYKRSKFLAERVAEEWAEKGLPVVIVNPSTPVGERDVKPTPTGEMIVGFLNGMMKAWVDTGMNLVDVRDVATGHLLAAERGRVGEKYILGHQNLTLREIFGVLEEITGISAPRLRLPHSVPLAFAAVDTFMARLRRRTPAVSTESVRMSRYKMFFDPSKAVHELGFPQSPVKEALARAVEWFRENGYVRN